MQPQIESVKFNDVLGKSCTYFTTNDAAPWVTADGQTIKLINGSGDHRSWGSPRISSRVLWTLDDACFIEVTGWHKHSVSPEGGEYFFVYSHKDGAWQRKRGNANVVKAALEDVAALVQSGLHYDISGRAWRNAANAVVEPELA
jgi:hypothetical protein